MKIENNKNELILFQIILSFFFERVISVTENNDESKVQLIIHI